VGLARTVSTYIEDHNFYVENWHHTLFWNKVREFGDRLVEGGFVEDREDLFFLNRWEVGQALYEMAASWATGAPCRGPSYWKKEIAERKRILDALRNWAPVPALGPVPEEINEPFTVLLWGITTERVNAWLGASDGDGSSNELVGVAGSPGLVEGTARVILAASQIGEIQQDEILVCPITAPSWGPVFGKIKAAVSDIGGIMSHAAIVSREYGLPAVVGTGTGTRKIKTGDHIRVDGNTGRVEILSRA
jgi:pyruvate,water dikinase